MEKKHPKFSVTIPAYKRKFLKECIESILAQTYKDFELIIVNDASPEDLDSIVNKFNDERIHYYINEKNCGAVDVVDNWNICLSYATGDYLICMGDDDKLMPDCLEEYDKLIAKYPGLGLYHGWTEIIDEESKFTNITASRCEYESVYSLIWHRWDNRKLQFIGDFLFEVATLRANAGFYKFPLAWASDDISAIIAAKEKGVANTQHVVFQYRVNSQRISAVGNVEIKMNAIKKEELWYEDFFKCVPEDELEYKYYILCCQNLKSHINKKYIQTISTDIWGNSYFRIFFWLKRRKKYHLTMKLLIYIFIEAVKRKNVHQI